VTKRLANPYSAAEIASTAADTVVTNVNESLKKYGKKVIFPS
jgi:hypothetical protein